MCVRKRERKRVHVCAHMCVYECLRWSVRGSARVPVCMCIRTRVCVSACLCMVVWGVCMSMCEKEREERENACARVYTRVCL